MANFKALAKDTAIYGLSSILGRFINYLLVPLYTYRISAASGGYGVITHLYAYTALFLVILTYGMETTFFYFMNRKEEDAGKVYSTILRMVGTTSALFVALVLLFLRPISSALGYADHPSYIWVMALTVSMDAFQCILFAYIRYRRRPLRFAFLKLFNIGLNIVLNLCFFVLLPDIRAAHPGALQGIYDPQVGVGYVFYINLACTALLGLMLIPETAGIRGGFDRGLMRRMLSYSWPLLILGIAGNLNLTADKMLFPALYKGADASVQLGIYGAASKVAMIMAMITQAFRYAYEPFVFGAAGNSESEKKDTYARGMKYFIIFTLLAFLCVIAYMDILRHVISPDYWEGLKVVPVVMAAEIMMGIYFNLSFWYKLIGKTYWGAIFSGAGLLVLVLVNVIFVPEYGYMACAWGGFCGYLTAMLLSYFIGQKHYPIAYPLRGIASYLGLAALVYVGIFLSGKYLPTVPSLLCNTVLVAVFAAYIIKKDLPLPSLRLRGGKAHKG